MTKTTTKKATKRGTTTYGSEVVHALELAWKAIQRKHPEVPNVVLVTGSGQQLFGLTWGHHAHQRWTNGKPTNKVTELFISGECIDQGAKYVLETLLHEACHAIARVRDIPETSRQRRYHNRRFVALAEELGLDGPEVPHPSIGWSDCVIRQKTVTAYRVEVDRLAKAVKKARIDSGLKDKGRGKNGAAPVIPKRPKAPVGQGPKGGTVGTGQTGTTARRIKITCACSTPRNLWCSMSTYEVAQITCGECGEAFEIRS